MQQKLLQGLEASVQAKRQFYETGAAATITLAGWMRDCLKAGGKILVCGNGGSAGDAQHFAGEFINRFLLERRPLPALALTTDSSVLTSIGNDYSFDQIFSKQVEALGRPGDLFLGISTSGNSENVVRAILAAKDAGMRTVVLTGGDGGRLCPLADLCLNVPVKKTPHIQETHIWILHFLAEVVEQELFGEKDRAAVL